MLSKKSIAMKILFIILASIACLIFIFWIGLQYPPNPPSSPDLSAPNLPDSILTSEHIASLPQPWKKFYKKLAEHENQRKVKSAIVEGTARLRISGITFSARFQFIHQAGEAYRHLITLTWFNLPIFTVDEIFQNGEAKMSLPMGVIENGPNVNSAANMALWAEAIWFPTLWLEDNRASLLQKSENHTGEVTFPWKNITERMAFHFDEKNGLITYGEAMRFKLPEDQHRTLWQTTADEWAEFEAGLLPSKASIKWMNDKKPWAEFYVTNVIYNENVDAYFSMQ